MNSEFILEDKLASLDLAKALSKLNPAINYHFYYNDAGEINNLIFLSNFPEGYVRCPSLNQAHKWLREETGIDITIGVCKHNEKKAYYYTCLKIDEEGVGEVYENEYFDTYEDALDAGMIKAIQVFL